MSHREHAQRLIYESTSRCTIQKMRDAIRNLPSSESARVHRSVLKYVKSKWKRS